jgi:hypothetical protein
VELRLGLARRSRSGPPKDIIIKVLEAGQLALAYRSSLLGLRYQSLPGLTSRQRRRDPAWLENGIERDYEVPEPSEPSFVEP